MMTLLDEIVLTDGNRDAFQRIIGATQEHEQPLRLFVYGPSGCGKTAVLEARGNEKDLLSSKTVMTAHSAELVLAVTIEREGIEEFLDKVGSADLLLIDGFDDLFKSNAELGKELIRCLLEHRDSLGLDTVVAARKPLAEYDMEALAGFDEVEALPLDAEGRKALASLTAQSFNEKAGRSEFITIDDAALDFIANTFAESEADIKSAIRFLVTAADFEDGHVVTLEEAKARFV